MPDVQLEAGSLLNERYRIIRAIGKGGMGTVYQAEHERLNATVAVKEIRAAPDAATAQEATMAQYEQEARFLVRLNHPNLPKVTDAFVDRDRFYLVMDFVEGATLDHCLRMRGGKPLDPVTAINLSIEIADVLSYLHSQSPPIIFRDLKPSNVMVQPDKHIKLIDFGIARRFQAGASKDTYQLGSVGYSPPEQFGKQQTDRRSDIYALGATMHHMLTARDPSTTPFKFVPVDQIARGVPMSLSRLIANCLAIDPDQRPPDVGVVSAELHSIRDVLNHVSVPSERVRAATDAPTPAPTLIGTGSNTWMPSSRRVAAGSAVYAGNVRSARYARSSNSWLRSAILAIIIVITISSAAISVNNGTRHFKVNKRQSRNARTHKSTNSTGRSSTSYAGSESRSDSSEAATTIGNGETDPSGQTSGETNLASTDGDTSSSSAGERSARCSAEVLGPSADGTSLRLHVTGEINGSKDTAGKVAVYFYRTDKKPLPSRDPNGAYATPSGQLFAEYTFQIDEDSKPIDGVIDVPMDQFTSTNNLLFKCIIYADDKRAGQTGLMSYSADNSASSGSTGT